jgi:hypothetical protein
MSILEDLGRATERAAGLPLSGHCRDGEHVLDPLDPGHFSSFWQGQCWQHFHGLRLILLHEVVFFL